MCTILRYYSNCQGVIVILGFRYKLKKITYINTLQLLANAGKITLLLYSLTSGNASSLLHP